VGKTALLRYLRERVASWHVATAVGVESEMELAYSGLHQLCAHMLDDLEQLPVPQRDALATTFGLRVGPPPDPFLVGLATLTLFAEIAERRPLVCIVDDAQWLDEASAQVVGFVARRLLAERVALVCGARSGVGDHILVGLPELPVRGLGESEGRALLLSNVQGPLDPAVREEILAESHGNPLALLELPRTWDAVDLAGGFGLPASHRVVGKIEQSYAHRLFLLPPDTRLLVLAAAAEPLGDPVLLHRAAGTLGLDLTAADAAVEAGLLHVGTRVEFAHPLARSAVYGSAAADDRHRVHRGLAEATDAETDPDRRAWHRARATAGLDEEVAAELERSADRAKARGGFAAAAAFLRRAVALTVDPARRVERALAAADACLQAGAFDAALGLVATGEAGPLDEFQRARIDLLRAQIAASGRGSEAPPLLLEAAKRLEPLDVGLARETYRDAFSAALFVGRLSTGGGVLDAAVAARAACPSPEPARAADLLLDGLALAVTDGAAAGVPLLKRALSAFRSESLSTEEAIRWLYLACRAANYLWDDETWEVLADRQVGNARDAGALTVLPGVLTSRVGLHLVAGEFEAAAALVEEVNGVTDAMGSDRLPYGALALAAWAGRESEATELIESTLGAAVPRGEGFAIPVAAWAKALLCNGLGRYGEALTAAQSASEHPEELDITGWGLIELIEAATRSGETDRATDALRRLAETTGPSGTDWAIGMEARSRALLSEGETAESHYREAIERLARCRVVAHLARAHLLYGEWLRREGRRVDAREQLRTAHEMLAAIGMEAFAERARRELVPTGETVRKRVYETRGDLTAQEVQIARLAADGHTNPEIGAQLFLSPRTVEWHLRKVFTKLGITSRRQLRAALPADGPSVAIA
jgi:DNA-binding CsgD family transcriptional regulator/tetratricopeptide (TPR) repeat protein